MMPADIDTQTFQLVVAVLFFVGLSGALAQALFRRFMQRSGLAVALLYVSAVVGGMWYFSVPYAVLLIKLCGALGLPLIVSQVIQIIKEDSDANAKFSQALREDRDAAS